MAATHAAIDAAKHGLWYPVDGDEAARTASLSNGGPLLARAESWWAATLGRMLVARANGNVEVPIDTLQFVVGESFDVRPALRTRNLTWHPAVPAVAQLTSRRC